LEKIYVNADEFREMRARKDIPHSDEICKDMHDRVPDRTTGSSMPSRVTCILFVVLPMALVLIFLFEGLIK